MTNPHDARGSNGTGQQSRLIWLRRIGLLVGALLLVAAVSMVARQHEIMREAWQRIERMPADQVALWLLVLIGSIIVQVALTGLLFTILISRYGKVGLMEMQALIASATLINYLPLRPGFFSRVAYHRVYNGIAVLDSTKAIVQAMTMSAAIAAYFVLAILARSRVELDLRLAAIAPLPVLAIAALVFPAARVWLGALCVRFLEALAIACRYAAAFALLGLPIDAQGALAFACISTIATMVPFLSNGLGLREWAVGLVAPLLTSYRMELGITADLMIRAGEMITMLALGSIGFAYVAKLRRNSPARGFESN